MVHRTRTAAAIRAVIYTRVSRDDTGEGRSNQRQETACRHLAAARGYEVVEVCQDISISAWSGKERPGWQRVLRLVETGAVDVVMAWQVDRMTRRMIDLEELILLAEDKGVGVITASGDIDLTTDSGRMVGRILAAVARAEVERKGARQRLANRQRACEGQPYKSSRRPFGYEQDGKTIRRREADALVQACEDFRGGTSVRGIARRWNEAGFISSTAKRNDDGTPARRGWTPEGVRRVLRNPRYAGLRVYRGEVVAQGVWDPIIDLETHLAVVGKLAELRPTRTRTWSGRTPQNLLSGIAICDVCEATLWANRLRSMLTYACPNGHLWVERYQADALVLSTVAAGLNVGDGALNTDPGVALPSQLFGLDLMPQRQTIKDTVIVRVHPRGRRSGLTVRDLVSVRPISTVADGTARSTANGSFNRYLESREPRREPVGN